MRALQGAGIACVLVGLCAGYPSDSAAGDYVYVAGVRHPLTRLESVWAVHADAPALAKAAPLGEAWDRHGVVIVRSARALQEVRRSISTSGHDLLVNPVFDYGAGQPRVVADEFIACFPPGVNRDAIDRINSAHGATILRSLPVPANTFVLRAEGTEELAALNLANKYVEQGIALFAQPNFIAKKRKRFFPDDPYFPHQWHLISVGQGGALPGQDMDAPAAWDVTRGDPGVIIAVIDDGVDLSHEDFQAGMFVPGYDFYDNDSDPSAVPSNGDYHGTAVTGVAAARGDNGTGVTGIAPACRVMPIRLVGGETSDEQDANAIHWAAAQGASIISNSWGPPDGNPFIGGDEVIYPLPDIVRAAIDYAADEGREGRGCVIIWAAGNGNEPVSYDGYAACGKVIAVGACDDHGLRPYYSDYGLELSVCASSDGGSSPGILTTDLMGGDGYNYGSARYGDTAGNYTNDFGGTSAAAPLAAGVAALLLSREPELTRGEVRERLQSTADRVDLDHASYDLNGHSPLYGHGRVNACAALTGSGRYPGLAISAEPHSLRQGGVFSLNFVMSAGRLAPANVGSVYLLVVPPEGAPCYVRPDYRVTTRQSSFAPRAVAADRAGILIPPVALRGIPWGRYTFYAVLARPRSNPLLPSSWLHTPAYATLDMLP